ESVNNVLLPDGSRGIICLPPAVLEGTVAIAFRKHLPVDKSLEQLRDEGRFTGWKRKVQGEVALQPFEQELLELLDKDDLVSFFKIAVRNKLNIVVSGSTGSGKSTFTRSLLREVPYTERIVVSEDVHEIGSDLHHEMVYMLYGDQDGRLAPAVSLKACMRLSPDRIMMTELRDDAAWDYINSLNTGHPGGITSTHADDAKSTFSRIALLIKQTGVGQTLDYDVIMKTLYTTIDVVVYMEHRQIVEVLYDPAFKKAQLSL
ncbi:TPA: Flp pilus assembly complex ATPase component TadA, partial [Klebsiella pneumoniae]|nr:Flp pilus assembly complex ATPase component TadA [Klebsiella pneumoniae]